MAPIRLPAATSYGRFPQGWFPGSGVARRPCPGAFPDDCPVAFCRSSLHHRCGGSAGI
ncbi:hypothetical protein SAMCFNEI73_Ch0912 [Sinorhizobium americanum]|uniref:Uncharacterized protein n=1 Tax=Sinorhizobium americanum TaxID=194963 RepID=A0A1L3LJF7_9HYPH|nr:hypothetical protein SAMCFNEI73_Ch0912 [Sinorhizobium americanum]